MGCSIKDFLFFSFSTNFLPHFLAKMLPSSAFALLFRTGTRSATSTRFLFSPFQKNLANFTTCKMTKTALIIASDGSEDIELIITSDVLRRAGVEVTIAGLQDKPVIELARKAKLQVDALFKDVTGKDFDAVVMPGGQPGSNNLAADKRVGEVLLRHESAGKIVSAICAAPIALVAHGVAKQGTLTSYPGVKDKITERGYTYSEDKVYVHNKHVVTSRGPGTAFEFALKLAELLVGAEKSKEVRKALLVD